MSRNVAAECREINTVRTDRGHEWHAQFHWYVEDNGMRHVYIKPRSPHLDELKLLITGFGYSGLAAAVDSPQVPGN